MSDGPDALNGIVTVSRETLSRLTTHVDLLKRWQPAQNLVAASTLDEVWRRHVADSAQLATLFPDTRTWVDLGSGAGFPGMVLAILARGTGAGHVHLVESNRRKCAFLRRVAQETDAAATVHEGRAETVLPLLDATDVRVAARAVAPLDRLIEMAYPLLAGGAMTALHKGQDFALETSQASKSWVFDLVQHPSRVGDNSVILELSNVRRRTGNGPQDRTRSGPRP